MGDSIPSSVPPLYLQVSKPPWRLPLNVCRYLDPYLTLSFYIDPDAGFPGVHCTGIISNYPIIFYPFFYIHEDNFQGFSRRQYEWRYMRIRFLWNALCSVAKEAMYSIQHLGSIPFHSDNTGSRSESAEQKKGDKSGYKECKLRTLDEPKASRRKSGYFQKPIIHLNSQKNIQK
jgi:hypothetical protein